MIRVYFFPILILTCWLFSPGATLGGVFDVAQPPQEGLNTLDVCPVPTLSFWLSASFKVWTQLHSFSCPAKSVGGEGSAGRIDWDTYDTKEEAKAMQAAHANLRRGIPSKLPDPRHFLRLYEPRHALAILSLLPEIEMWLRANRSVGMHPFTYQNVISKIEAFTNESIASLVESKAANSSAKELDSSQNNTREAACESVEMCFWKKTAPIYAQHARDVLARKPWLIVNPSVFQKALLVYQDHVYRGTIIRSFSFPEFSEARVERLLQLVQRLWDRVDEELSQLSPPPPLLPWVDLDEVIGPPQKIPKPTVVVMRPQAPPTSKKQVPIPTRTFFRHHPWKQVLPTAVVYRYSEKCESCEAYGVAFDLLPAIYRRICEEGHNSIVSCSPLILFVRMRETRMFSRLPSFSVYSRSTHLSAWVEHFSSSQWIWSAKNQERERGKDDSNIGGLGVEDVLNYIDIDELREFLRRPDDFKSVPVPYFYWETPEVNNVILSILMTLVKHGSIQLRLLSQEELSEIRKSNQALMEEEERLNQSLKEAALEGNMFNASSAAKNLGAPKAFQKVATIDKCLKNLIKHHMEDMYGNNAQPGAEKDIRNRKDAASSHFPPSTWYELTWPQMMRPLSRFISPFHVMLLILLIIVQYRWNRHQKNRIW